MKKKAVGDTKDYFICNLCIHKELYADVACSTGNTAKVMREHLSSKSHKEKFALYEKEPWRFPFVKTPLEYHQLATLVQESAIREGKK